jgi:hypothetical protein
MAGWRDKAIPVTDQGEEQTPPTTIRKKSSWRDKAIPVSEEKQEEEILSSPSPALPTSTPALPSTPVENNQGWSSRLTNTDDVKAIAKKYGVDPDELLSGASFRGADLYDPNKKASLPESLKQGALGTLGVLDEAVGGPAKFLLKKAQKPEMRAAIDELTDLIQKNKGYGSVASEVATSIAAPAGVLSKVTKLPNLAATTAGGVGLGAAYGLFGSKEGQEAESAAIGAGIGLAGAGVAKGLGQVSKWFRDASDVIPDLPPDKVKKALEEIDPKVEALLQPKNFEELTALMGSTPAKVRDFVARDPVAAKEKIKQVLVAGKAVQESVDDGFITRQASSSTVKDAVDLGKNLAESPGSTLYKTVARAKQNLRLMDNKYGYNLEQIANKFSQAENEFLWNMHKAHNQVKRVNDLGKASKLTDEQVSRILDMPEEKLPGILKTLSSEDKQKVGVWKDLWEEWRQKANEGKEGLKITPLKGRIGYVPLKPKQGMDAVKAFNSQVDKAADSLKMDRNTFLKGMQDPDFIAQNFLQKKGGSTAEVEDLRKGLAYFVPSDSFKLNTPADVRLAFDYALNPEKMQKLGLETSASATYKRDNGEKFLPDFLREWDVNKLAQRWLNDTFKYKSSRLPSIQMQAYIQDLRKRGEIQDARYVENYLRDMLGARSTLGSRTNDAANAFRLKQEKLAEAAKSPVEKAYHETIAEAPEMFRFMQQQMYPYYLGLRVDKALRNYLQPVILTTAEISSPKNPLYGYGKWVKAAKDSNWLNRKSRDEMAQYLIKENLMKPGYNSEAGAFLRGELKKQGIPSKALQGMNDFALYLYNKSDIDNRLVSGHMAKSVIDDLFKGDPRAAQSVNGWAPSYRRAIAEAYNRRDIDTARKLASEYLIDKTQFNYDKASMAAYGRYMGNLWHMFSTWPSEIGGDITTLIAGKTGASRARELQQLTAKYMAPTLVAAGLPYVIDWTGVKDTPVQRQIIGKNTAGISPVSALSSFAEGQIGPPALVETAKLGKALTEGKPESIGKQLEQMKATVPTATYYERLTEDFDDWLKIFRGQGLEQGPKEAIDFNVKEMEFERKQKK